MNSSPVTLRSIAVVAFLPPGLFSLGVGSFVPMIPLAALERGFSVASAAVIAAMLGLGQVLSDPLAGRLTTRYGERRVMLVSGIACAAVLGLACLPLYNVFFVACIIVVGAANAVWMLARLTYVADVVPVGIRARAMSSVGGVHRMGTFVGPLIGAGAVHFLGTRGSFLVGLIGVTVATGSIWFLRRRSNAFRSVPQRAVASMAGVLRSNWRTFATAGVSVLLVAATRSSQQIVIPLWGQGLALDASSVSLIYGLAGLAEVSVFYIAGFLMDRRGRVVVGVLSMIIMATALLSLVFARDVAHFVIVSFVMGLGNGFGSGLVMTIGADVAPAHDRTVFFGIWRQIADIGSAGGPFLIGGLLGLFSMVGMVLIMAGVGVAAAGGIVAFIRTSFRDRLLVRPE